MRGMTSLLAALCLASTSCFPPITVAGFGDSLTAGRDWIAYLPSQWTGLDFGIPGDRCWRSVGERAREAYPTLDADVVVLFCGTNDVRQSAWTLERTMSEIERAAREAQVHGFKIVLVVPPPIFADGPHGTSEEFNRNLLHLWHAILQLGALLDAPVADLWSDFWAHPDPQSLFRDGVHPNQLGRVLMSLGIQSAILAAISPPEGPGTYPSAGVP